jgi:hypothetical protein
MVTGDVVPGNPGVVQQELRSSQQEWGSRMGTAELVSGEFSEYLVGLMTRRSVTHPVSKVRKALRHGPRCHGHNSNEQQGMTASETNLERIRYLHVALLGPLARRQAAM